MKRSVPTVITCLSILIQLSCTQDKVISLRDVPIAPGWAENSVNTVIFRGEAIVSQDSLQFCAFYGADGYVMLARRHLKGMNWEVVRTPYAGNVRDAHNSISIMLDGRGYLHMAWDHHDSPLHYCRSREPGGLELTSEMDMTGELENKVTYPEFKRLPDGNLLFFYRDGSSGKGNLILKHYDVDEQNWTLLHSNLIDGENERNAYWQLAVDQHGVLHLSWVWRESWDVATNHDLCYARSPDDGKNWECSSGQAYRLPITLKTAEVAAQIPQGHELINQTSMSADALGHPYIMSYWREEGSQIPQYHLIWHDGARWLQQQVSKRRTAFSLSGGGTKRIPISRPAIFIRQDGTPGFLFRDAERGNRVSAALCKNLNRNKWSITDLTAQSVGQWEPNYDLGLWSRDNRMHVLVQHTEQGDAEQTVDQPPQMISVLECCMDGQLDF